MGIKIDPRVSEAAEYAVMVIINIALLLGLGVFIGFVTSMIVGWFGVDLQIWQGLVVFLVIVVVFGKR